MRNDLIKFSLICGSLFCADHQSQTVLNMIVFLRFGMPILGYIASLISMYFYEITNEKYEEIRKDLDARHQK